MHKPESNKDDWGFPNEREFMENLVCERFNFLLVFFGLVVGGALACETQFHLQVVLWLGALIVAPMALVIAGAQWKLEEILGRIFLDKNHPITIIHRAGRCYSLRWIIGYAIPFFCSAVLLLGAIFASLGILNVK